jgi:hypothetical protein
MNFEIEDEMSEPRWDKARLESVELCHARIRKHLKYMSILFTTIEYGV